MSPGVVETFEALGVWGLRFERFWGLGVLGFRGLGGVGGGSRTREECLAELGHHNAHLDICLLPHSHYSILTFRSSITSQNYNTGV